VLAPALHRGVGVFFLIPRIANAWQEWWSSIGGFNLYHALDYCADAASHSKYRKYKWLNLVKLSSLFVYGKDTLENVLYFTTIASWDAQKAGRHRQPF
jgi:hypothetical protein